MQAQYIRDRNMNLVNQDTVLQHLPISFMCSNIATVVVGDNCCFVASYVRLLLTLSYILSHIIIITECYSLVILWTDACSIQSRDRV